MDLQELSWRERGRLWLRLGVRLVLTTILLLLLWNLAPPLFSLFMPFVLALLLAWLLNPLVRRIQKRLGISRKILSLVLIVLLSAIVGGALVALFYSVISELISLANNWQSIWDSLLVVLDDIGGFFWRIFAYLPEEAGAAAEGVLNHFSVWLQTAIPTALSATASRAGNFAMQIPSFAVATVVFVMGSYFITADYPHLREMVTRHLSGNLRDFFGQMKRTAVAAFGGYVKAQVILALCVFFILLLGFTLIRQPYAILLAFLLAALDLIPIVGSGTVMVPWAVGCLFLGDLRGAIELMVIWGVIVLFRQVSQPKIVGDQTGLSPVLALISVYVGMRLGGVAGMILGPVFCLILINVVKIGVFGGVLADVRLAAGDIAALLKNQTKDGA